MASKGLSPLIHKGLNKKRMAKGSGAGNKLILKQGDTATVQFLTPIDGFIEYEVHVFRDGKWNFVPCAGDGCPLCADEDNDVAKTSYQFACNVYSFKEKKVLILNGPKDLAGRIAHRYEHRKSSWLRRTWDISKFPTQPVSYDVESADDEPINVKNLEGHDLEAFIQSEMDRYFGNRPVSSSKGASSLDDDDDFEDDDDWGDDSDELSEDDLLAMKPSELQEAAEEVGIKVSKVTKENRRKVIKAILKRQS